ncbi:MAG: prepilin peptidase [Pelagibacteraceae bacterium]|nr:prepilin peptidase [Pelagibacteraceae bacterium]MCI5079095.1 prepilin peptidase [Pelagibacteraceae bacterium]
MVVETYLFLFGLIVGSFFNVCILRLPKDQDIFLKSSACPNCNNKLKWYHNIPLVSFIFLLGKCHFCKKIINFQYPLVEIITAFIFVFSYSKFDLTLNALFFSIFLSSLVIIFFTDLNEYLILDIFTLPFSVMGFVLSALILNPFSVVIADSFAGLIIGFSVFYLIRWFFYKYKKIEGMGLGDAKLMMMIGAWLGLKSILFVMFFSSVTALIVAIPLTIIKKDKRYPIPYGCFITLAAFLYILIGDTFYKFLL